jgi:hypothetical protein
VRSPLELGLGDRAGNEAPRQDALSGVISCPVKAKGRRLRVNSITAWFVSLLQGEDGGGVKREA